INGAVSATLVALVILGGIRRIGQVTSKIMPAMAILYFLGAILILAINITSIPTALATIVTSAMQPTAALGGFAGATFAFTITWGVKRGLFSNEAGQGSAPIAHAAARTEEPVREGAVALLEPSIDTLIICTLTGLVIVVTGTWKEQKISTYPVNAQSNIVAVVPNCTLLKNGQPSEECFFKQPIKFVVQDGRPHNVRLILNENFVSDVILERKDMPNSPPLDGYLVLSDKGKLSTTDLTGTPSKTDLTGMVTQNASPLTAWAFERGLNPIFPFGSEIVTLCVFLFAISTAIGWSYYGDRSAYYLFGEKSVLPYKLIFVAVHFLGAVFSLDVVWGFGDAALGMMSFPNLLAILALSPKVAQMTREYFSKEHQPFVKSKKE
ncbi:MAG: amino acid carrier protein, partial [Pseudomonadota bacterium]